MILKDGHTDISSSRRMCSMIIEDANDILKALALINGEASLPTWWTNKLAVSSAYVNSARDYIVHSIDMEEETHEEPMMALPKSLWTKNDDMRVEIVNEEGGIEVGSYRTKHFDMCPTA